MITFTPAKARPSDRAPVLVVDRSTSDQLLIALGLEPHGSMNGGELLSRIRNAALGLRINDFHRTLGQIRYLVARDQYRRPSAAAAAARIRHRQQSYGWWDQHLERTEHAARLHALTVITEWAIRHRQTVRW